MSERLSRTGLYPIVGWLSPRELGEGGLNANVRARWTGEKRPPRKGEWYLSGAIIEAYRAPNDLTQSFHIAKLYHVKTTTSITTEVLGELP